jgi:hypothetical protein
MKAARTAWRAKAAWTDRSLRWTLMRGLDRRDQRARCSRCLRLRKRMERWHQRAAEAVDRGLHHHSLWRTKEARMDRCLHAVRRRLSSSAGPGWPPFPPCLPVTARPAPYPPPCWRAPPCQPPSSLPPVPPLPSSLLSFLPSVLPLSPCRLHAGVCR